MEIMLDKGKNITLIRNKIDLTGEAEGIKIHNGVTVIRLCAKTNQGIDALKSHLKDCMGYTVACHQCGYVPVIHLGWFLLYP
jgi:tRNA modification GTPase